MLSATPMQRRAQITNAFKGAQRIIIVCRRFNPSSATPPPSHQALVFCSSVQRPDVAGEPTSYPQADGRRSRRWGHMKTPVSTSAAPPGR